MRLDERTVTLSEAVAKANALAEVLAQALPLLEEAHAEAREGFQRGHQAVVIGRVKQVLGLVDG